MLATGDCWFEEEDDDDERECGNNRSTVADCWCIKEDDGDGVWGHILLHSAKAPKTLYLKKLHIVASLAYCATIHAGSYDDSPARKPFVILHLRTERKRTGRS
jgi:hypothetical protein